MRSRQRRQGEATAGTRKDAAEGFPGLSVFYQSALRGPHSLTRSSITSKTKSKKATSRAVSGRRPGPPPRRTQQLPVLPIAVGLVLLAVLVVVVIAYRANATNTTHIGAVIDGVSCDTGEHVSATGDHHYHAHVEILYQGQEVTIPAQTGIPADAVQSCFYWLHTHDTTGVIHIEAPAAKDHGFTLGQFFDIWGQKLSPNQVGTFKISSAQPLKMWVNGQPYTGNPRDIVLHAHDQIVLEIGPTFVDPPPTFTFPSGL